MKRNYFSSSKIGREEIKSLKDTMPWPPCPSDLEVGQFLLSLHLGQLSNTILSGKTDCSDTGSKCLRLKQSFGQDIIYVVSSRKTKTPKNILLPQAIKTLTNTTNSQI